MELNNVITGKKAESSTDMKLAADTESNVDNLVQLIKNLGTKEESEELDKLQEFRQKPAKDPAVNFDRLYNVNNKISETLNRIHRDLIDEQDTSIKQASASSSSGKSDGSSNGSSLINTSSSQMIDDSYNDGFDIDIFDRDKDRKKPKRDKNRRDRRNRRGGRGGRKFKLPSIFDRDKTSKPASPDKATQKPAQKPVQKPVQKPASPDKATQKPASPDKATQKPASPDKAVKDPLKKVDASAVAKGAASDVSKKLPSGLVKTAGVASKLFKSALPVASAALSVGESVLNYMEAESDAERTESIAKGAGGTAGAIIGGAAGVIFGPVGVAVGSYLGSQIGEFLGEKVAQWLKDPQDDIPDEITKQGPAAVIQYIDGVLIPKIMQDPSLDDKDKKKAMEELDKFKLEKLTEQAEAVLGEDELKSKDKKAFAKAISIGAINETFIGNDDILDVDKLKTLSKQEIHSVLRKGSWSSDDKKLLTNLVLSADKQTKTTDYEAEIKAQLESAKNDLQEATVEGDQEKIVYYNNVVTSLEQSKEVAGNYDSTQASAVVAKNSPSVKPISMTSTSSTSYTPRASSTPSTSYSARASQFNSAGGFSINGFISNFSQGSVDLSTIQPSGKTFSHDSELGAISASYESNGDPGTISTGARDKGGKSYGSWQIASKTGTLAKFIDFAVKSDERYAVFKKVGLATPEFDQIWKRFAEVDPEGFLHTQFQFIKTTHYDPVVKYAESVKFPITSKAIKEALWSQSVQQGFSGNKKIINAALGLISNPDDPMDVLNSIYTARSQYVSGLDMDPRTKASVLKRYQNELADAKSMQMGINQNAQKAQVDVARANVETNKMAMEQSANNMSRELNTQTVSNNSVIVIPVENQAAPEVKTSKSDVNIDNPLQGDIFNPAI